MYDRVRRPLKTWIKEHKPSKGNRSKSAGRTASNQYPPTEQPHDEYAPSDDDVGQEKGLYEEVSQVDPNHTFEGEYADAQEQEIELPVTPDPEEQRAAEAKLAETSQALQSLFFGVAAASVPKSPLSQSGRFEPSTKAAAKSPRSSHIATFASSLSPNDPNLPFSSLPTQLRYTPTSVSSPSGNSTKAADLASPRPYYPSGGSQDSLLRILQQSALTTTLHQQQQQQSQQGVSQPVAGPSGSGSYWDKATTTTNGSTTAAPSTVRNITPSKKHYLSSNMASPSFTDYRESGLSPSTFLPTSQYQQLQTQGQHQQPAQLPAIYTDDEREEARGAILAQLASQLGAGPTPPSPDELDRHSDTEGSGDDDGAGDTASPVQDLLAIFRAQMQEDGSGRQIGDMKLTNAVMRRLEAEQIVRRQHDEQTRIGEARLVLQKQKLKEQLLENQNKQRQMEANKQHPRSREEIMKSILQAQPPVATRQDRSSSSDLQARPPFHKNSQIVEGSDHKAKLLGLFSQPAPTQDAQIQVENSIGTSFASTSSLEQLNNANTSSSTNGSHTYPHPMQSVSPVKNQQHTAGLLSLFNGLQPSSVKSQSTSAPNKPNPARHLTAGAPLHKLYSDQRRRPQPEEAEPHLPADFANGNRLAEFKSLMAQDEMQQRQPDINARDLGLGLQSFEPPLPSSGLPTNQGSQNGAGPLNENGVFGVAGQGTDALARLFANAAK